MTEFNYDTVYSHRLSKDKIQLRKREILRYMGQKGQASDELKALIDALVPKVHSSLNPKGAFVVKKIQGIGGDEIVIDNMIISSRNLSKNLRGCKAAVIFAMTIGSETDRFIARQSHASPLGALAASAIGAEAIECYVDVWQAEIGKSFEKDGLFMRPRFSPGYGDFSLKFQENIISLLTAPIRCGICVTDKLILTPSKSVTGMIGLSETNEGCIKIGCEECAKTDCAFRRNC